MISKKHKARTDTGMSRARRSMKREARNAAPQTRGRHRECAPLLTAVPAQMPNAPHRYALRFVSLAAGVLLICWVGPVRAAESAMCRELDHRFDQARLGIGSAQLNSALFSAADTGCEGLARKLLAAGASLAARDGIGTMPLAHAALAGQRALVELFLAAGADIDARDISRSTALYLAAESERPATVTLLLAKDASPDLAGRSGLTPLAVAALKGNDRIAEELLSHHADPNVPDESGMTAIAYAASHGFAPIVRRLLDAGIDANRRYRNNVTALMWAAAYEDGVGIRAAEDVIDVLLKAGADIDAADNRGRTALTMAAQLGHAEMVDMLIKRGANPDAVLARDHPKD
jgi:ankyrin repeat protein